MSRRTRLLRTTLALGLWALLGAIGLRAATTAGSSYLDEKGDHQAFFACDNVTSGGTIAGNAKGCANPTFQPARLTSLTEATGGSGALEYLWMMTTGNPAGGQPVSWQPIAGSGVSEFTPSPITRTTYFIRCTRREGCTKWGIESNYVTISIDCCENVTDGGRISGDQTSCGIPYDPSLLSNLAPATGGAEALIYSWFASTTSTVYSPGSSAWIAITGVMTPFYNPGPISEPTRYVRVAQRAKCAAPGAWSNVVTVNAFQQPSIKSEVMDVTCAGQFDGTAAVTIINAASPFTYRWLDDGSQLLTRSNLAAGIYQFELTDGNGCTVLEEVIVASPAPLSVVAAPNVDLCNFNNDAAITATVGGGTVPYTYVWNSGETSATISGKAAGSYRVNVTDAKGCTQFATVNINPPARLSSTLATTQPLCYQSNGSITASTTGGLSPYSYAWSPAVSTTAAASGLAGGVYTVVITDDNGCSVTLTTTLDATPGITIALDGDDVTCNGAANAQVRSTVTGGTAPYTYRWSTGATTATLQGVGPGSYTLTVTDAKGCGQPASITLVEPNALSASIDVVQPICFEDGGRLTATIVGGTPPYNFNWGAAGQNNLQTLNDQPAGNYTLNVTDAGGCNFTASATVETTVLLSVTAVATDASCPSDNDGAALATVVGGTPPYRITWSDDRSQTSLGATQLIAGSYTISVTDARGCVKTANVTVGTRSTGPVVTEVLDSIACVGAVNASINLSVTGGIAPYSYLWNDGPTTEDRTALVAGTYMVTVTDAAGCFIERSYIFSDPKPLTCKASPTTLFASYFHAFPYGNRNGEAAVAVTGGAAPYTFAWSSGSVTSVASGLPGGPVSVTVTDSKGCACSHDTLLVQPSMISDFVWEDLDGDGIQDAGEPGLPGIAIRINGRDFNNRVVNFSTVSDGRGAYRFDQMPMGAYTVSFRLTGVQDYLYSPANQGADDTKDSDMDPVLLQARKTITAHGIADYDLDAGFIPRTSLITIGDKVWYDADHDGVQDPFEVAVQGVTMRLYRKADNSLVNTVASNEDGEYEFTDVVPGTYYIHADQSTSSIAAPFIFSRQDATTEGQDSDFDPSSQRSQDIVVTVASTDIKNLDLGLHEDCPTLAVAGAIAGNEDVCVGQAPGPITSVSVPGGVVSYRWIRSTSSVYRGPNDPNWTRIAGANNATYQPGQIATTVYYIRLATSGACAVDFTGTSNVIGKQAIPTPVASLASAVSSDGGTNSGKQITMCQNATLTVTADSLTSFAFVWNFGADATPSSATGRAVRDISFPTTGARFIYLSVTNAQGCVGRDSFLVNTIACVGPGQIGGIEGLSQGGTNTIRWSAISLKRGSYFEIERALDGTDFEALETVSARSLGDWLDYTFVDRFAPSGKTRYRVIHRAPVTKDVASNSVQMDVEQVTLRSRVYPNPARDAIFLEVAAAERGELSYSLHNAFGATLRRGNIAAGVTEIDLKDLPTGTYYLHTVTHGGETEVRPIVKQ